MRKDLHCINQKGYVIITDLISDCLFGFYQDFANFLPAESPQVNISPHCEQSKE